MLLILHHYSFHNLYREKCSKLIFIPKTALTAFEQYHVSISMQHICGPNIGIVLLSGSLHVGKSQPGLINKRYELIAVPPDNQQKLLNSS